MSQVDPERSSGVPILGSVIDLSGELGDGFIETSGDAFFLVIEGQFNDLAGTNLTLLHFHRQDPTHSPGSLNLT
jgi:hypothetical protein